MRKHLLLPLSLCVMLLPFVNVAHAEQDRKAKDIIRDYPLEQQSLSIIPATLRFEPKLPEGAEAVALRVTGEAQVGWIRKHIEMDADGVSIAQSDIPGTSLYQPLLRIGSVLYTAKSLYLKTAKDLESITALGTIDEEGQVTALTSWNMEITYREYRYSFKDKLTLPLILGHPVRDLEAISINLSKMEPN